MTATCKDATSFTGTSRRGACSGHGRFQPFGTATVANPATQGASTSSAIVSNPAAPSPLAAPAVQGVTSTTGQVWVSSSTKVYHCLNDRYYGKTKAGSYMTEAAAKAAGDHPSHGKVCAS